MLRAMTFASFEVNSSARSLHPTTYVISVSFNNTTTGQGNTTRVASVVVNPKQYKIIEQTVVGALQVPPKQLKTEKECAPTTLFEGRNKDNNANVRQISLKCDNFPDLVIYLPDDKTSPMMALMDTKRRRILRQRRAEKAARRKAAADLDCRLSAILSDSYKCRGTDACAEKP
jgi:hypothetical protein